MTKVRSRLVLAAMATLLLSLPGCLQPGSVPDEGGDDDAPGVDAGPGDPDAQAPPPGSPDAAPQAPPTFTANIYGALAAASCTGCHTQGQSAQFLPMDDGAATVYARLMDRPNVVQPDNVEASLILQKPLTGSPVPHRAKLFADTNNPTYKLIKLWIEGGALQ